MPAADADLSPFKFTYEDYCAFPEDGRRHEILDGMHVVSPSPSHRHQHVLVELTYHLRAFLEGRDLGEVLVAPFDVLLGPHDVVQPDLVFFTVEQLAGIEDPRTRRGPALVIEVLSRDKRHDVVTKRARYQAAGVPEYWLVDPELDTVEVLRLDEAGVYQTALRLAVHTGGGRVESPLLPGLALDVAVLFRR